MAISTGDILRIVATMLWSDGNVMQNVFNAVISGAGGPWPNEDVIGDALTWVEAMYDAIPAIISDEVTGSQIVGYVYDSVGDDWDEFASENWAWDGTNITDQIPRGAAGLLNLKTSDPDVNGKKYIGGIAEDRITDGLFTGTCITDLIAYGVQWATDFVGSDTLADWAPGVWSPKNTAFYDAGLVIIIPTIPAYQRRRKRGIGI